MTNDMRVPFIDMSAVNAPYRDELRTAFDRVLQSSAFSGGLEVEAFESVLSEYIGVVQSVAVASGTAALQLALAAAQIGRGDEVILPANTFIATAEAVVAVGATPVLVDCDPDTALMDLEETESRITSRTKAIIPVHLYGQPVNMDRAREIASKYGLFLLEDNAQAIGASWNGVKTGSLGDAGCISFYPGKNLGALGEGGAVTTSNEDLASNIRLLRDHGSKRKYVHDLWGLNERMHGLQGAFLAVKLAGVDRAQALRDGVVNYYKAQLVTSDKIGLFSTHELARHVYHLFVVQVDRRDAVLESMVKSGIGVGIHYPVPLHLTPAADGQLGKKGEYPNAERLSDRILSLPLFSGMTTQQVDVVVEALHNALR